MDSISSTSMLAPLKLPQKLEGLEDAKLRKASKEFEGLFLDMVMKSMRSTSFGASDFIGDSEHVKTYQQMLDTEYSKELGKNGKVGIADALYRQFTRDRMAEQAEAAKAIEAAKNIDALKAVPK